MSNVSINSSQRVYGLLSSFESTPWKSLGEFIDNSLSSWMSDAEGDWPISIDITFDPDFGKGENRGQIVIKDNALGISTKDLDRAFELGEPPAELHKLNQFGVGMKVAACWFGKKWCVETSAIGEPIKRTIFWDTEKIVKNNLEKLPIIEEPARADEHYTIITITDLVHSPNHAQTILKIKKHIPKMFRKFIETGLVTISWNGEELLDVPEKVLRAPLQSDVDAQIDNPEVISWEKNFEIQVTDDLVLECYACLFERFDKQHTGLNYFWRNRLIQGNVEPFHRPKRLFGDGNSFRTGRLYIEVMANDLRVTSNKGAIDFGSSGIDEDELIEKIRYELQQPDLPLFQQAEAYRSTGKIVDLKPRIETTLDFVAGQAKQHGQNFLEEIDPVTDLKIEEIAKKFEDTISDRVIQHNLDGHPVKFRISCVQADALTPWATIEWDEGSNPEHVVLLNLAHPFVNRHLNQLTLPVFIGTAVSLLYGEYKALSLVPNEELRLLRKFTDKFLRYMAITNQGEILYDAED